MAETTVQPQAPKPTARPNPPRRPRRSFAKRVVYAVQMRIWQMFSPDALIASLKSLAWVVPMTVLIWVYAEREQTGKLTSVPFRVEARNNDPNRIVELTVQSPKGEVQADLTGPQARLEQVRERLQSSLLQIDVPPDFEPGKHPLDLLNALANHELFVKNGITVTGISPARIDVMIDVIDHRGVDVRVRPTVTNLDGPASFDPPRVIVSGPKSVLDAASAKGNLIVYADLPNLDEPGLKKFPGVQVTAPISDPRVTVSPATVSATLTVKKSDVDGVISSVAVFTACPQSAKWDRYKAKPIEDNIVDVKVTGPADMINKVNDPDFEPKPKAFLDVTTADPPIGERPTPGKTYTGKIHYDFGQTGLKVARDAPNTISFTIVERKPPPE